ncbi:hypothetical protein [Spirosoma flavum]|uniref:DUF3592 domain-containing protein n=1 Tax=Spirosoma flavum TaxID=2048557 RepID=A0ABW6AGG0_9BACT
MVQKLFTALGRLYSFLLSLIISVILGVTTWGFWVIYQDATLQSEFTKEGQLVSVRVEQADQNQRSWRDILSHSTYLTFTYRGKAYTTRFVMDSAYVGAGDRVKLLYHAGYEAFRQPGDEVRFDQSKRKSRLIGWTTVREFTNEKKLLLLCLLLSTASFFFITGFIVTLIPIPFLQDIARFVFIAELVIAAIFFTYDAWAYLLYYQHIKATGRPVSVKVLATQRIAYNRRNTRHSSINWYHYQATIRYQQQERVIPISHDDFDALKPSDLLNALHDESVDDFMSVTYSPDYGLVILPAILWLLTFILLRPAMGRSPKNGTRQP